MTETWAGLLRAFASDDLDPANWKPELRRLASMLEQITPEDALRLRGEWLTDRDGPDEAEHWKQSLADRLAALAATPSEETD